MSEIRGAIYPDLEGKTVIVTGGASGIGEAIVRHFQRQKTKTAFMDVKEEEGQRSSDLPVRLRAITACSTSGSMRSRWAGS